MCKRFWLGAGLLAVLGAICMGFWLLTDRVHEDIADELHSAAELVSAGQREEGSALADRAREHWERCRIPTSVVADHTPMDTVDSLFAFLKAQQADGTDADLAGFLRQLSALVRSVSDAQAPYWWNLL